MNKEEFLKAIMELPKVETNNPISTMTSINVDDLMSAVDRLNKVPDYNDLLKENQELREALEIKSYCKYANKCNEIYDCSREEYEDMANANMRLHVENQELKEKFKATNKGLQKAVLKRKKWKYRYQLARCKIKELKEKLDKYENPEDMTLFAMWCTEKVKDENEKLKKHLKVPKACNLKTLEDYKSYYEDTTREQILEDTYIEYCAYVNLAHRYSELKKQLENKYEKVGTLTSELLYEENTKLIKENQDLKKQLEQYKGSHYCSLIDICKSTKIANYNQQKEFIKYLEDEKDRLSGTCDIICVSKFDEADDNLQEYKRIIGYSEDE